MNSVTVCANPDHLKGQISFEEREQQLIEQEQREEMLRKQEKGSPYKKWTQYNLEHTEKMINLLKVNPVAGRLLFFLVDQMDNYNAVMCSYTVLEEALDISRPTITRAIRTLKELGFIAIYKSGTSNVYTVNDNVFWKSWGNKKRYSKFPANVILAESEQQSLKQIKSTKTKQIELKDNNE